MWLQKLVELKQQIVDPDSIPISARRSTRLTICSRELGVSQVVSAVQFIAFSYLSNPPPLGTRPEMTAESEVRVQQSWKTPSE